MKASAQIIVLLVWCIGAPAQAQTLAFGEPVCSADGSSLAPAPAASAPASSSARLLFDLAQAYEREGRRQEAYQAYQRAIAALADPQALEQAHFALEAHQAAWRLHRSLHRESMPKWGQALVLTLTLLLGATVSQRWRMGRRTARRPTRGHQPRASPDDFPVRSIRTVAPAGDLLDRRLGYLHRVAFEPAAVAASIHDPVLARRLLSGQVVKNTHLFDCAAALEEALEGKTFDSRPSNTYAAYLRPRFRRRGWQWPMGLEAWRAFFAERASAEGTP